ncbi:11179_t:CDS:1, partial [Rhizophagus irregularis]
LSVYNVCVERGKDDIKTSSFVATGQLKPAENVEGGLANCIRAKEVA